MLNLLTSSPLESLLHQFPFGDHPELTVHPDLCLPTHLVPTKVHPRGLAMVETLAPVSQTSTASLAETSNSLKAAAYTTDMRTMSLNRLHMLTTVLTLSITLNQATIRSRPRNLEPKPTPWFNNTCTITTCTAMETKIPRSSSSQWLFPSDLWVILHRHNQESYLANPVISSRLAVAILAG